MTIDSNDRVTKVSQMQTAIVQECSAQIAEATRVALACPNEPHWTRRSRLLRDVVAVAPDCSEHMLYAQWRGNRTLEAIAQDLHHAICGMRFSRLAGAVNQWADEEDAKEETYRLRLEQR